MRRIQLSDSAYFMLVVIALVGSKVLFSRRTADEKLGYGDFSIE
jgi:hypothetical protein